MDAAAYCNIHAPWRRPNQVHLCRAGRPRQSYLVTRCVTGRQFRLWRQVHSYVDARPVVCGPCISAVPDNTAEAADRWRIYITGGHSVLTFTTRQIPSRYGRPAVIQRLYQEAHSLLNSCRRFSGTGYSLPQTIVTQRPAKSRYPRRPEFIPDLYRNLISSFFLVHIHLFPKFYGIHP